MKRDNRRYGDLSDPADNLLSIYDRWTDDYLAPEDQTLEQWARDGLMDLYPPLDFDALPDFVESKDGMIPVRTKRKDHRREIDSRDPSTRILAIIEIWENDESVPENTTFADWAKRFRPDLLPLFDEVSRMVKSDERE